MTVMRAPCGGTCNKTTLCDCTLGGGGEREREDHSREHQSSETAEAWDFDEEIFRFDLEELSKSP